MLNISSSQPMGWPSAPPNSVAPVQAVSGVGAAPAVSKESPSDTGSGSGSSPGRHGQAAQAAPVQASPRAANDTAAASGTGTQASPQAAPLLPRERQPGQGATPLGAGETEESNLSTEQRQDEDKKAREKAERALREADCDLKDMKYAFLEADGGISVLKESSGASQAHALP